MGARTLRRLIGQPLRDLAELRRRQALVARLVASPTGRAALGAALSAIGDLERLTGRITQGQATPNDFLALGGALRGLPPIADELWRLSGVPSANPVEPSTTAPLREAVDWNAPMVVGPRANTSVRPDDSAAIRSSDAVVATRDLAEPPVADTWEALCRRSLSRHPGARRSRHRGRRAWSSPSPSRVQREPRRGQRRRSIDPAVAGQPGATGAGTDRRPLAQGRLQQGLRLLHRSDTTQPRPRPRRLHTGSRRSPPASAMSPRRSRTPKRRSWRPTRRSRSWKREALARLAAGVAAAAGRLVRTANRLAFLDAVLALAEIAARQDWVAPELTEGDDAGDRRRSPPGRRGRPGRRAVHAERLPARRRRATPARRHRPEHGRQVDLSPPGRGDRPACPDRLVRAGGAGPDRAGRSHLHPRRRAGRPGRAANRPSWSRWSRRRRSSTRRRAAACSSSTRSAAAPAPTTGWRSPAPCWRTSTAGSAPARSSPPTTSS